MLALVMGTPTADAETTSPVHGVSVWRWLISWISWRPRHRASAADADTERRVWIKFPSSVETICPTTAPLTPGSLAAKVRNVSRGGVSLLVEHRFEPGSLLDIELPSTVEHPASTVLAYVVHATERSDGTWSLGCTFAREVAEEDLEALGAPGKKKEPPDQRNRERSVCKIAGKYQVLTAGQDRKGPAEVLNIWPSGVGLLTSTAIDPGTLLSVELSAAQTGAVQTILACVVHVTYRGEQGWALGCNFIRELSTKELRQLLGNSSRHA
jgi:hypothetical protein